MIFFVLLVFFVALNNWIIKYGNINPKYKGADFGLLVLTEAIVLYMMGANYLV